MAWESFAKQVGWYRYGSPSDASRWITAAQQCRRLFHVPLIDTLDLAMPAFDDLVCELYVPPKVGAAPAAA
jgi:hypothetical protein